MPAVVGTPRSGVPVRGRPPRLDRTRPRTRRRHVHLDPRPPRPLPARTAHPARPVRRLHPQRPLPHPHTATPHCRPCPPSTPSGRRPTGDRCPSATGPPPGLAGRSGRRRWWLAPVALILALYRPITAVLGTVIGAPPGRRGRRRPGEDPAAGPRPAPRHHQRSPPASAPNSPAVGHRPGRRPNPAGTRAAFSTRPQRRRRRALPAQPGQLDRRRRPPLDDHPPPPAPTSYDPARHLDLAIPWVCANLRTADRAPARQRQADRPARRHAGLPHRRLRPRHRLGHRHPRPPAKPAATPAAPPSSPATSPPCTATSPPTRTDARTASTSPALPAPAPFTGASTRLHRRRPHQPRLPHPRRPGISTRSAG